MRLKFSQALAAPPPYKYAAGDVYPDQYLSDITDAAVEFADLTEPQPEGRRLVAVEYRGQQQNGPDGRTDTEQGLVGQWTRETLNYGQLRLSGAVAREDSAGSAIPLRERRSEGTFLAAQDDFALTPSWRMDHAYGDQAARASAPLSSSARVALPSSLMRGYSMQLRDTRQTLSAVAGQVGQYEGLHVQSFARTPGRLTALEYEWSPTPAFFAAARLGDFRDGDTAEDHTNFSAAIGQHLRRLGLRYKANALVSDGGAWGAWTEADSATGAWRHRYGVYRLDPDLLWNDVRLANDRRGLHWRADSQNILRALSAGIDVEETNIDDNPAVSGRRTYAGFLGGSRQIQLRTRAGATLNANFSRPGPGLGTNPVDSWAGSLFAGRQFSLGASNIQLAYRETDSLVEKSDAVSLVWDHDWVTFLQTSVATTLGAEQGERNGTDERRVVGGLSVRRSLLDNVRLTANVNTGRIEQKSQVTAAAATDRNTSAHMTLAWTISPEWQLDLAGSLNRRDPQVTVGTQSEDDSLVLLTLRYVAAAGVPYSVLGHSAGTAGVGRISGAVFLDDNNDGVRNAGERAVAGLLVFLDGRTTRQTDLNGRFEFAPVFSGEHTVSLAVENVPLPFGLADEAPRVVVVAPRGESLSDFPLVRITE